MSKSRSTPAEYLNRELSWLEFNQRVLDEARNEAVPLLERLKFLAITASNLDEFFMVRVGGLHILRDSGNSHRDPSGLHPQEQLDAINARTRAMIRDQYACFVGLEKILETESFARMEGQALENRHLDALNERFQSEILSVLAPLSVSSAQEFPHLINQSLNVAVRLDGKSGPRFAVIPFARTLPRFITLPSEGGFTYILLEDVVARFAHHFFPGDKIVEVAPFRVTRNADVSVREDQAIDLMSGMEKVLDARKKSQCIRLEVASVASPTMVDSLSRCLQIDNEVIHPIPGPLDLSAFFEISLTKGFDALRNEPFPPLPSPTIDTHRRLFDQIAEDDILLYHPYDSFDPVTRFIEEAADDPDVIAIKQILYRCSRDSAIIAALKRAAQKKKYVTVVVELKARFDEERNIEWARDLESEDVQVFYGVKSLKTHAKMCAVVRREPQGIRRYLHFGTGNYNESTAKIYSDASLFTVDPDLGYDAISFFNAITGYSEPRPFRKLEMAPLSLKSKLLELIDVEIKECSEGRRAFIDVKVNSLADTTMIQALYRASQAGVKIRLNIRGVCCLRPGVKGLSENIEVVSVIDRFLEHARIVHFCHGGADRLFLSSADWMPRNLDRRVELLVPVEAKKAKKRLFTVIQSYFDDNVKAHRLHPDGSYTKIIPTPQSKPQQSQVELYRLFEKELSDSRSRPPTRFEPYQAPKPDRG